jgi:hypothetical protein
MEPPIPSLVLNVITQVHVNRKIRHFRNQARAVKVDATRVIHDPVRIPDILLTTVTLINADLQAVPILGPTRKGLRLTSDCCD